MPPRPSWLRRLPDAINQLEGFTPPTVTRAELQTLLGIGKARAVALMHTWDAAPRRGGRGELELDRAQLLKRLRAMVKGRTFVTEGRRVEALHETLERARVSRVRLKVDASIFRTRLAGLPDGVTVEQQQIVVAFTSPMEAFEKLYALAQALQKDWSAFEQLVENATNEFDERRALAPPTRGDRNNR